MIVRGLDTVFATGGDDGIRLWNIKSGHQLLHIRHSELNASTVKCLAFTDDGKAIVSGWSDG